MEGRSIDFMASRVEVETEVYMELLDGVSCLEENVRLGELEG